MKIVFTVLGNPRPKRRPRFFKRGNFVGTYTDTKTKRAEQDFLLQALKYRPKSPLKGEISIRLTFYLQPPKSLSKKKLELGVRPAVRPDVDNLLKLSLDALNKIFFRDDGQIVSVQVDKYYSDKPRTEIIIEGGMI